MRSQNPPNRKGLTILLFGLALLAIPSSIAGINEFTNIFDYLPNESNCVTGMRDGWYKNCEYKFQFDLPKDNWIIRDSDDQRLRVGPLDNLNFEYWLSFQYEFGANFTSDAFGSLRVMKGWNSFAKYNQMMVASYVNDTEIIDLSYIASEYGKFEISYEKEFGKKIFSCTEMHVNRISFIYLARVCINNDSIDIEYIGPAVWNFWQSFRFF